MSRKLAIVFTILTLITMVSCSNSQVQGLDGNEIVSENVSVGSEEEKALEDGTSLAADEANESNETPKIAETIVEPEYIFKYAELNPKDNISARVAKQFAEYVNDFSNGRIRIDVYTSGELGTEAECVAAMQAGDGTVDFFRTNTNVLSEYGFNKLSLFALPYLFTDRESMWSVLGAKEIGESYLSEGIEIGAGLVGIYYIDEGTRNIFLSQEISSLSELKGMKIRVPGTSVMVDTIAALGAEPIQIEYSKLYDALMTGEIEGAENSMSAYNSNKFYESASFYFLAAHSFSPSVIFMAEEQWNKLSAEDQEIIYKAGMKAADWNKEQIREDEKSIEKVLLKKGVTIIACSEEDKEFAREACQTIWKEYAEGVETQLQNIVDKQEEYFSSKK